MGKNVNAMNGWTDNQHIHASFECSALYEKRIPGANVVHRDLKPANILVRTLGISC